MNNTTFGDKGCGYYETICGGSGAVSCIHQGFIIPNHLQKIIG